MFLNNTRFSSDGIANISHLLTELKPSSIENLIVFISDITRLNMVLDKKSIDYMIRVRSISQRLEGVSMEKIIPLFAIARLYHDWYPGVKSRYLVVAPALVNCELLGISGILSRKYTEEKNLGLPRYVSLAIENCASDTRTQSPSTWLLQPHPILLLTPPSHMDYTPPMGVPWNYIAKMVGFNISCPGCHYNKPDAPPWLKFHQEVGWPALSKNGYTFPKDVTESEKIVINVAITGKTWKVSSNKGKKWTNILL